MFATNMADFSERESEEGIHEPELVLKFPPKKTRTRFVCTTARSESTQSGPPACNVAGVILSICRTIQSKYRREELLVNHASVLGINKLFPSVHQMPEEVPGMI